jgi:hypothetical protein
LMYKTSLSATLSWSMAGHSTTCGVRLKVHAPNTWLTTHITKFGVMLELLLRPR